MMRPTIRTSIGPEHAFPWYFVMERSNVRPMRCGHILRPKVSSEDKQRSKSAGVILKQVRTLDGSVTESPGYSSYQSMISTEK